MKVIVDNRETKKRKEKAQKVFEEVEIQRLESGDYVCKNCAIELKTTDDFIASIKDGRVFRQAKTMNQNYGDTYIIIYGDMLKSIKKIRYYNKFFSVNSYIGALASLSQNIRVLSVANENQAFNLMRKLFEKSFDGKNRSVVKPKNKDDRILGLIMYLGGIGEDRAKRIIKENKINNLNDLLEIKLSDLTKINGIGKKTANKLINNLR